MLRVRGRRCSRLNLKVLACRARQLLQLGALATLLLVLGESAARGTACVAPVAVSAAEGHVELPAPKANLQAWRPTRDDVERISRGKRAKARGTGSKAVPHRLDSDEREAFERAKLKGFLELRNEGLRSSSTKFGWFSRGGSPLWNTYRNWCDALAVPMICVNKADGPGGAGSGDQLLLDVSTARPAEPEQALEAAREAALRCGVTLLLDELDEPEGSETELEEEPFSQESPSSSESAAALSLPIHKVREMSLSGACPRSEAKGIAARLAAAWGSANRR
ncbi:unnamed protein product [Polarella glacialis]|uniref:Uncharacterized protein n=1 Tax=Polarella glacialis TaxID=89957 RepID=A0A813J8F6_POLGL|nr:unnamed protein product [Polarella glacialis]